VSPSALGHAIASKLTGVRTAARRSDLKASSLLLTAVLVCASACTRSHARTAYVDFRAVADLREGAPVTFQGVQIGTVQKLTLRRSGTIATLLIDRADAPLQSNDRVAVRPVGIFGDDVIDIVLASAAARPLRDGDTLQVASTDSLAPVRDLLMRAVAHEFTKRLFRSDSTRRSRPDSASSHP
jgi:ABC-type transporter Mla subunit MlaD